MIEREGEGGEGSARGTHLIIEVLDTSTLHSSRLRQRAAWVRGDSVRKARAKGSAGRRVAVDESSEGGRV